MLIRRAVLCVWAMAREDAAGAGSVLLLPPTGDHSAGGAHLLAEYAQQPALVRSPARTIAFLPRKRSLLLAVAALAVALVAGAAFAAYNSLIRQAYQYSPSLGSTMEQYAHPMHVSATACGYTLALAQAYADTNRVTVSYTLSGPLQRHFDARTADFAHITTLNGRRLLDVGLGMSSTVESATTGHFQSADTSHVAQTAKSLTLRMTLLTPTMVERVDGSQPASMPCERYQQGGTVTMPGWIGQERYVTILKPLSLLFTVPVDRARRAAAPHQTIVSSGTGLVLDHLVVTRTEARVFLRRTTAGHILEGANLTLHGDKSTKGYGAPLFNDWWVHTAPASRLYNFTIEGSFYSYHGPLTLTVRADQALAQDTGFRRFSGGPWVFHFTLP